MGTPEGESHLLTTQANRVSRPSSVSPSANTDSYLSNEKRTTTGEDTPSLPRLVGKYEILEQVGVGGMGVVFKAYDPDLKRVVALKMILAGLFASPEAVSRFLLEREALARVNHPNIVPIYDAGRSDGQPFVVLEYLLGGSLSGRLEQFADPAAAVSLVERIARAVHELHRNRILHRDLKPSNILFNGKDKPLLTDFGIIKMLGEPGEDLTQTQQISGTPAYMAPEQTGATEYAIGTGIDIWALGVTLFELLTSKRPFTAPDRARWLRGEPLHTRPERLPGRIRRVVRRHPLTAVLAGTALVALALVFGVAHLTHPDRSLEAIEGKLRKGKPVTLIGEKGAPVWSDRLGGRQGTAATGADGFFTVSGWDTTLVRLCKDPGTTSYRFRAKVRHEQSNSLYRVGLFVACETVPNGATAVNCFYRLSFNDRVDEAARFRMLAPAVVLPNADVGNRADLSWEASVQANKTALRLSGKVSPIFTPTPRGSLRWRELSIEVRPDSIRATFDGRNIGPLAVGLHMVQARKIWVDSSQAKTTAQLAAFAPEYFPRGSLGLYIDEGRASFCDVVIEPLPVPVEENP